MQLLAPGARRGDAAMAGGEVSSGGVATTGGDDDGEGGPANRQRGRRGGRLAQDRQPEGRDTAGICKQGPCLGAAWR